MVLRVNGKPIDDVPDAALPNCEKCDKPDLDPSSFETLRVYNYAQTQREHNPVDGSPRGLRATEVLAILGYLTEAGEVEDPDLVFRRILKLDEVVCSVARAKSSTAGKK